MHSFPELNSAHVKCDVQTGPKAGVKRRFSHEPNLMTVKVDPNYLM